VFIRHPPATIRYEADRPVALLGVRTAPWYRLVDLPLGPPTTSARSERGTWALFALGEEVVVVHPDGAVSGPPADVAAEVGRLASRSARASWTARRPGRSGSCWSATVPAGPVLLAGQGPGPGPSRPPPTG
jgi:hypothetical protein